MIGALPSVRPRVLALSAAAAFAGLGLVGAYRYVDNYWLYRGFAPPRDAGVRPGSRHAPRASTLASPALGGRRQPVDVYLPPGYAAAPGPPLPGHLPAARRAGPARRVPRRPFGWASSRTSSSRCTGRGPMILVMPFGSTGSFTDKEWANGDRTQRRLGDVRRARSSCARSTRATARSAAGADARSRASPRAATARSTSASTIRASSRRSRAGRATSARTTSARSSATDARCSRRNSPLVTLARRGAGAPARAHLRLVLQRQRRHVRQRRTRRSPQSSPRSASRTASSSSAAVTTGRSGAATRRGALPRRVAEARVVRRLGLLPLLLLARGLAASGWLYLVRARRCRARASARRCRSTSSRSTRPRRCSGSSPSGALAAAALGLYARWAADRAGDGRRCSSPSPSASSPTSRPAVVGRRRASDLAARRARRRRAPEGGLPACRSLVGVGGRVARRRAAAAARAPLIVGCDRRRRRGAQPAPRDRCPATTSGLLRSFTPDAVGPLAHAAGVLDRDRAARRAHAASRGGAIAPGRSRRRSPGSRPLLHVLHGLNDGTLASAVVLVLLVARRTRLRRPG